MHKQSCISHYVAEWIAKGNTSPWGGEGFLHAKRLQHCWAPWQTPHQQDRAVPGSPGTGSHTEPPRAIRHCPIFPTHSLTGNPDRDCQSLPVLQSKAVSEKNQVNWDLNCQLAWLWGESEPEGWCWHAKTDSLWPVLRVSTTDCWPWNTILCYGELKISHLHFCKVSLWVYRGLWEKVCYQH